MSPYMKLKQHILNVHKNQPGPVKARATPKFTCGECNIEFPNLQTLREHNKTHPPSDHLICDVCERPIKGSHFNLLLHKFSHKNDNERLEAIRNKERGAYNAFLSAKLNSVYTAKNKKTAAPDDALPEQKSKSKKKRTRTKPRKVLGMRGASAAVQAASTSAVPVTKAPVAVAISSNQPAPNVASTSTNSTATRSARAARRREQSDPDAGIAKPYGCRICNKYFSQKNHLTSHMRSHGFRRSERGIASQKRSGVEGEPIPSTSAAALASHNNQSIGAGIASRRRGALAATATSMEVEPPLLSPVETAALAENLEKTINEVCNEMGISLNAVEDGGNEGEEELDAPELKREVV
ncbi:Zinc finger homeobox protein 3 [Orchesella cincta]|uniref:Zinc finger homeobox protein 3 n=1 Tax=Orchesella cincta TaxID=48709 RepID=A0A1D2NDA7_ORCCI|nr:Zinc finger homeobox protein 3 [Orchesella cincta]